MYRYWEELYYYLYYYMKILVSCLSSTQTARNRNFDNQCTVLEMLPVVFVSRPIPVKRFVFITFHPALLRFSTALLYIRSQPTFQFPCNLCNIIMWLADNCYRTEAVNYDMIIIQKASKLSLFFKSFYILKHKTIETYFL